MAKIIENEFGRRQIELSVNDVINIVREYQNNVINTKTYDNIRTQLKKIKLYLPEDI